MPKIPEVEEMRDGGGKAIKRQRMREKAEEVLSGSDMESLLEMAGAKEDEGRSAAALLKSLLAEKAVEYILKANEIRHERRLKRLGSAAMIIAARNWD